MTFAAGRIPLASDFVSLGILYAVRNADLSVISTTLADDAFLQFSNLAASAIYSVNSFLIYKGSTAGDFKVGWSCSGTGATFNWMQGGLSQNDASSTAQSSSAGVDFHGAFALSDSATYAAVNAVTSPQVCKPNGILTTGTGSGITFKLRWSQGGVDGSNGSSLLANSYVWLSRLA